MLTVSRGRMQIRIVTQRATLGAGDAVVIPADTTRRFVNPGPGALHLRAILASAHFTAVSTSTGIAVTRWAV